MKYSVLIAERRGAASIDDAERVVGGPQTLKLLRQAGWLHPKIQAKKVLLFDYDECLIAWKRLGMEGYEALKEAAEKSESKKNAIC